MPLVPMSSLVAAARGRGGGVVAFNAICLEHAEAIAAGAEQAGRAAVIQVSENAVRFHLGNLAPIADACRRVAEASPADLAMHLDHVVSDDLLHQADAHGFGSVMYDASGLPYDDNVAATRSAVEWGHARGLWVESELGEIGGKNGVHAPGVRTDPQEAASYVSLTGVDALAVAVGSSHAMLERTAALDHDLIERLAATLPVPLVLHGSSGVPDDSLRRAVEAGIVKVNIGTALNIAFTTAVRDGLAGNPDVVDPRRYLAAARDAMADVVASSLRLLAR